jgi:hypothetical protein
MDRLGWQRRVDLNSGFTQIFEWIRANEEELRSRYVPPA